MPRPPWEHGPVGPTGPAGPTPGRGPGGPGGPTGPTGPDARGAGGMPTWPSTPRSRRTAAGARRRLRLPSLTRRTVRPARASVAAGSRTPGRPSVATVTLSAVAVVAVGTLSVVAVRASGPPRATTDAPAAAAPAAPAPAPEPPAAAPTVPVEPEPEAAPDPVPAPGASSDLYEGPPDRAAFIRAARARTATIECDTSSTMMSIGSAWPIDPADLGAPSPGGGTIFVTNGHVIDGCPASVRVQVDGRWLSGTVTDVDFPGEDLDDNDLALVRVDERIEPFPVARTWEIGHWVIALGSPSGIEGMVTFGIISNDRDGLIWTDALINPGNSGGPLLNSAGQVVGVNTWGLIEAPGIGIAQPVERLCDRLLTCGGG